MRLSRLAVGALTSAAAVGTWTLFEAGYRFAVREHSIPAAPNNPAGDLRILHMSDLHLRPTQRDLKRRIRALDRLRPDLVIYTGDSLSGTSSVPPVLDALAPLLDIPGVFVFGSNDYFAPRMKSPSRYFTASGGHLPGNPRALPAGELAADLTAHGWIDLRNRRAQIETAGWKLSFVGVDDPHIDYDRYPADDGVRGDLHIGVGHAPYSRVLDAMTAEGVQLSFFGHTHGGQVALPLYGALVTNTDLPNWRAKGLQVWPGEKHDSVPGDGQMWVNISAGLGTSPYTPVRLACPPEVSLLRFTH